MELDGNSWTNIPAITNASNAYIIDPEAKLDFCQQQISMVMPGIFP